MSDWYKLNQEEALEKLGSGPGGLSPAKAAEVLGQYGKNELPKKGGRGKLEIFLEQFKNFMVLVLIGAVVVSALHQDQERLPSLRWD